MLRRIPDLVLWVFLAAAVVTLPVACGDDDDETSRDAAPVLDSAFEAASMPMTGG
jgi:hypothetical protein